MQASEGKLTVIGASGKQGQSSSLAFVADVVVAT